jgi:hypothetical protein
MNLQQRINLLVQLGDYMLSAEPEWQAVKDQAFLENGWFAPIFINSAIRNITSAYLKRALLENWAFQYHLNKEELSPKNIGLIMAGNIPLVGFHDFLSVFVSGHLQTIKPSSKDSVLIGHLVKKLNSWQPETLQTIVFAERLTGCDAYIATGSNNSGRYFEYYLGKYPHLIRRNRSSVAILNGNETVGELDGLADDVCLYFGLGCRNVSKIFVPLDYDFKPLLAALTKYRWLANHHKYRNNYDYQLAALLLNNKPYLTSEVLLLTENSSFHSPISVLNFEYYEDKDDVLLRIKPDEEVQCVIGQNLIPFGLAQRPNLTDYPDAVDTLQFLLNC